ncbi:Spc7-domain-containing protein [Biscogniauxia mediterranea]|nr:Spc7-domain-containing protein [Biscogniauxia mediterranea]
MSSQADAAGPSKRRPRKSTGHSPVRKRIEKENITVDVASSLAGNGGRKKSRSKSMGPGGLDVLKAGSGNRRVSLAAPARPPPRSILKPTIPIVQEIPPHKPKTARKSPPSLEVQGKDKLPNPFQNDGTKIALRTEEEQQAAAREREERERAQLEKEINDRREARRKSLANRRVSFAAEATLHTFHEVEYNQDSTTSTDSTRRASARAQANPDASDPPSTPPEQAEDIVPDSPEHQRDLHQKNRRRSSVAPLPDFSSRDDETLASSVYSSDSEGTDGVIETHEEIGSDSGSDSDADGVSMELDADEMTGVSAISAVSARSAYTVESNDTLDDALRLASRRAVTQSLDEEEEIIPSFGWAKKPIPKPAPSDDALEENDDMEMDMDMDMTNAMGSIIKSKDSQYDFAEEEMSMDVTRALGGILPQRRKSTIGQLGSPDKSGEGTMEDATMDFTTAMGGIQKTQQFAGDTAHLEDEDMSMELTTVLGGLVPGRKLGPTNGRGVQGRRRTMAGDDGMTMDMTVGLGRILPSVQNDEEETDATMGMDITMPMGRIIESSHTKDRTEAKHLMEEEVDQADSTPILVPPSKSPLPQAIGPTTTSDAGSPGFSAFRGKGLRRTNEWSTSENSKGISPARNVSPPKSASPDKPGTPSTPLQSSPLKTPASNKSQGRSASPKRLDLNASSSTPRSAAKDSLRASIFQQNPSTGVPTPQVILTPQPRRLSGIGADRPGLGSPKIAAIFDRRGSIGEVADDFVPQGGPRVVSFADPRIIEDEVDRERQLENDKENGRKILEREAAGVDEDNTTATLKDMISSMTPKKNPLKGRKSLHVGSASGLLGKRPVELDDDEAEERDGIKRLKGHQSSPVKNIRLHAPPSKAETTGRLTRSAARASEEPDAGATTPALTSSPNKGPTTAPSPKGLGRFRDVESDQPTNTVNFDDAPIMANPETVGEDPGDRIPLQDFLNMTSIRFMELTTTKRRHTQAPTSQRGSFIPDKEDLSLERCVVAGACTVPTLELYQHSCRELKKYISEGRRIVREIETETLEENPPLFREYMSATPEFKILMDNQFKNVKTHARLLSKAMWYEWRMKLQDGLKEGLVKIAEGMADDEKLLRTQQELLDSVLPSLTKKFESLQVDRDNLQSAAQELADCDPEELQEARAELVDIDSDIQTKMQKIEELRRQLSETESSISEMSQKKQSCIADIEEAEKVREECRGWTSNEISSLKAKVEGLEKKYGWAITGIADTTMSMTYQREIELVFDVSSFQGKSPNSRIDLWYVAANREQNPQPATPEKEFFIQVIRDHVRGITQAQTKICTMLDMVSAAWKKANHVAENVRLLNCTFPTTVSRTSDFAIAIRSTLLLATLETKVEIILSLSSKASRDGVDIVIVPSARVVYGEHFKADKVTEYLANRIGTSVVTKEENNGVESWSDVIVELHGRLIARGKK